MRGCLPAERIASREQASSAGNTLSPLLAAKSATAAPLLKGRERLTNGPCSNGDARLVERQQLTHLPMQAWIRERIGPQLVTEKALEDFLREDDRVQRHGAGKATALGVIGAYRTKHLTKLDVRPTIPSTQVERGARRT